MRDIVIIAADSNKNLMKKRQDRKILNNPKPTLIHFVEDLALILALYLHSQEKLW
jgi:hypothetical protein